MIPSYKQLERTSSKNYRPISLLPCISKLYERDMYNQITCYMENHLSPYLFGFRKAHSTEQCLNTMLENWKKISRLQKSKLEQYSLTYQKHLIV